MTPADLEKKATKQARTVDPSVLPFTTSADKWQTWLSPEGQWIFIEKEAVSFVAAAFGTTFDSAFDFMGKHMLKWLADGKNVAGLKPRTIWKIEFQGRKDAPVNFGIFSNQCFVFLPKDI